MLKHPLVQYSIQYRTGCPDTVQCSRLQCSKVKYSRVQKSTVQYSSEIHVFRWIIVNGVFISLGLGEIQSIILNNEYV